MAREGQCERLNITFLHLRSTNKLTNARQGKTPQAVKLSFLVAKSFLFCIKNEFDSSQEPMHAACTSAI